MECFISQKETMILLDVDEYFNFRDICAFAWEGCAEQILRGSLLACNVLHRHFS